MTDKVEVTLNLPAEYRSAMEKIAGITGLPLDHVVTVILALHILQTTPIPASKEESASND